MSEDYQAIIVSHTHWDREWYLPYQRFRARLLHIMDEILEVLDKDEKFRSFTLDGQTAILEDYLEIKPERRKEIERLVKEGRLFVGPWYIQMDEFLEGDEALIRNLIIGLRMAKEHGGAMPVGYVPDSFGHIAQLPQLLRGFDIDSFIFTRGMGDEGEKLKTEFIWRAPDGSEVLAVHLLKGYCNADLEMAHLLGKSREKIREDPKEALPMLEWLKSELLPKASTNYILLMNGCDHRSIQQEIPVIIERVNKLLGREVLMHGSLVDYVESIKRANVKLGLYQGELRGARYHAILAGVLSSRLYLKRENILAQTILQYYAEPLATYAWMLGYRYPSGLLLKAWKYLIQNQAHDTICCTCIDEIHRENVLRFLWVKQIAEAIIEDSLNFISKGVKTTCKEAKAAVLVFNPLNWSRSEVVKARISKPTTRYFEIKAPDGQSMPYQIISADSSKISLVFMAEDVPPCGYKTFAIVESEKPPEFSFHLRCGENELENEILKVSIDPENGGSMSAVDKRSGRVYKNLNELEDEGDAGDEYYSFPTPPTVISKGVKASIEVIERGPVKATLKVKLDMLIPRELNEKGDRRSDYVPCPIAMNISTYLKIPRIDISGEINNQAKDHKLRAIFPTNLRIEDGATKSFAHDQFHVTKRPIIPPKGENWIDHPPTTHPQRFFVDINNGATGLMVANKGLPEYEVRKQGCLQILLTLLRCVGWLSRDEKIGPIIPTPGAQCLGTNRFEYSIIPHDGDWLESRAYKEAYNFNMPLIAFETGVHEGNLPPERHFLEIYPDKLVLTAVKKSQDEDALVVRFYNISDEEISGRIKFFQAVEDLWISTLDEKSLAKVEPENGFKIDIKPYKIVTLKAKIGE